MNAQAVRGWLGSRSGAEESIGELMPEITAPATHHDARGAIGRRKATSPASAGSSPVAHHLKATYTAHKWPQTKKWFIRVSFDSEMRRIWAKTAN